MVISDAVQNLLLAAAAVAAGLSLFALWSARGRAQRLDHRQGWATDHGFVHHADFAVADEAPTGFPADTFDLFCVGDGRRWSALFRASAQDTWIFDFGFYRDHTDTRGRNERRWSRYDAVLTARAHDAPKLRLTRSGLLGRLRDELGMRHYAVGDAAFDDAFHVSCHDHDFATALLTPQTRASITALDADVCFELSGRWLLVYRDHDANRSPEAMITLARQVLSESDP